MSFDDIRRDYASLADELNDRGVTMTVDDFDEDMVERAKEYATLVGAPFPPGLGDFDRWWDRENNEGWPAPCPRCEYLNQAKAWQCQRCGVDLGDLS